MAKFSQAAPNQAAFNQLRSRTFRELQLAVLAFLAVVSFGTAGFRIIEGWSAFDALYMTMITVTTVGFGEVHPLSETGRAFALILIVMGVGVVGVLFTSLTQQLLQRQLSWIFESKRTQQMINKLSDHTILCGFGRLGQIAAAELKATEPGLVIIDNDDEKLQRAQEQGFLTVKGDASEDGTLLAAGVERAKRLVSLLPKDSDNLYVILTSRELNPALFVVSRAEDDMGEKRLKRAGAHTVVSPYRVGGHKIAYGLTKPYVTDFLDLAVSSSSGDLQIEEIKIPDGSPLHGKILRNSSLRQRTNIMVAAIISATGEMEFNPSGDSMLESGDTLIALGLRKDFDQLARILPPGSEG